MYFIFDRFCQYIQFGPSRIDSVSDYLCAFSDPSLLQKAFENHFDQVVRVNLFKRKTSGRKFAVRFCWRNGVSFLVLRDGEFPLAKQTGKYLLWDIEKSACLGSLPHKLSHETAISADLNWVRIDRCNQQLIIPAWSAFFHGEQRFMVTGDFGRPTHQTNRSGRLLIAFLGAIIFAALVTLARTVRVPVKHIPVSITLNPASHQPQILPNADVTPHGVEKNTTKAGPASRTPEKADITSRNNKTAAQAAQQQKFTQTRKSYDGRIDPMRCRPISQRFSSAILNRMTENPGLNGEWYVCR
jgi:hypothetical protein